MFSVEESGKEIEERESEENLLQKFVDYITIRKVVMLEDLANEFRLPTKDVIDRIERLLATKKLTGIIDDRGKFIYITNEEFEAVMNFVKRKGRISRSDLIMECNRLIKLNPSEKDKERLMKEQSQILQQIETDMKSMNDKPSE